ncbi:MAG: ribosomal protein S18-alanine N-acetyltransferase [Lachnospiraceae bacterium]|nr:ribosomal protein S18-alanine N-acetyltransferase [Lachnospiraceae bacterium]
MSQLMIRPGRIEDAPTLRKLEKENFTDPWSEEGLVNELASPLSYIRVAETEGRIVAYLIATRVLDEGELLRIAVSPRDRVQGIGKQLTEAMLQENPSIKVWRLDVRESNYGARKLYESLGFLPVVRRRNYYEKPMEDGVMMMLENRG